MAKHRMTKSREVPRGTVYKCSDCDRTVVASLDGGVDVVEVGSPLIRHAQVNPMRRTRARGVVQPFNLGP